MDNSDFEVDRYFRTSSYDHVENFYSDFFEAVRLIDQKSFLERYELFKNSDYLSVSSFYSDNDKWFRYLRDEYLIASEYRELMNNLMLKKKFNPEKAKTQLCINDDELKEIDSLGHIVGLHSYNHPMKMSKLSIEEQGLEYKENRKHLSGLLNKPITVMSHPVEIIMKIHWRFSPVWV